MSAEQTDVAANVTEGSFTDFQAMKSAKTLPLPTSNPGSDTAKPAAKDEPAPNSGADKDESRKATPVDEPELTEADVEKENARVRRKMSRLLADRAKERAQRELAERRASDAEAKLAEKDKPKPAIKIEGRPKLNDFLEGKHGEFKTFAEAHDAWEEAKDVWLKQDWEAERSKETERASQADVRKSFKASRESWEKANPKGDFQESFDLVAGMLEGMPQVSDVIVRSENPAIIIDKLAHSEEFLESLSGMPEHRALAKLGAFIDKIEDAAADKTAGKGETTGANKGLNLPKPPKGVIGRGDAPSGIQAMRNAADTGNFAAFQAQKHAMKTAQK